MSNILKMKIIYLRNIHNDYMLLLLQVHQRIEVFNLCDLIIVKLQFFKRDQCFQIFDFFNEIPSHVQAKEQSLN